MVNRAISPSASSYFLLSGSYIEAGERGNLDHNSGSFEPEGRLRRPTCNGYLPAESRVRAEQTRSIPGDRVAKNRAAAAPRSNQTDATLFG
jgi:hypothetical protein